jgi:DNA-binding transcriptional regulator GbsR (MarR family)
MIEACARLCQLLSLPRTTGQIYGLLYLSTAPISLDDMVDLLGISKASASTGTRQLVHWGAIRSVWVPGDRKDYFEAVSDLTALIRGGYTNFLKPRMESSERRLTSMEQHLDDDLKDGFFTPEEHKICTERLKNLGKVHKKFRMAAPIAEKLLL